MDIKHLIRDAEKAHAALKEEGDSLIAVKPCKIYVPERYFAGELGTIDDTIRVVGIFAIVVDDKYYGVSRACALMRIGPSHINVVTIANEKYMEFLFNPGDKVIVNLNLVRVGTLVYRIYVDFISKGRIPWFFNRADVAYLFDTALTHGNANLRADYALLELLASSMARQPEDKSKFFRHDPRLQTEHSQLRPTYIPLKSVAFGSTNTTSKLLGAYFQEGLTSALVNPSETVESLESLLRA